MQLVLVVAFVVIAHSSRVRDFSLELREALGAPDGYPRLGLTVGGAPRLGVGPLLRVQHDDVLRIRVTNLLPYASSMHWHGVPLWRRAYMDGSPHTADCAIAPGQTRLFEFPAPPPGTYWYHSHSAAQYMDGLLGPIVVDHPPSDVNSSLTDYIVLLQEWFHETSSVLMSMSMTPHGAFPGFHPVYPFPPTALLMNGHGKFNCSRRVSFAECEVLRASGCQCLPLRDPFFGSCGNLSTAAQPTFACRGKAIRLRLINASGNMPLRVWIERHSMLIVALDAQDLRQPIMSQTILLPVGQRVDVIVECTDEMLSLNNGRHRVMVSLAPAFMPKPPCGLPNITTWGWLVYPDGLGASEEITYDSTPDESFVVENADLFKDLSVEEQLRIFDRPVHGPSKSPPAQERIVIESDVRWEQGVDGSQLEYWLVNGKSWISPQESPLQFWKRTGKYLRSPDGSNIRQPIIIPLKRDVVYEVIMINLSGQQHPWHLHGYSVDMIDCGFLQSSWSNRTASLSRFRLSETPFVLSRGDSWLVPERGFMTFRFKASNPGPWFFHCHVEWHMMMGMALIFSVEPYDDINPFPFCGESCCNVANQLPSSSINIMALIICLCCSISVSFCLLTWIVWSRFKKSIGSPALSSALHSAGLAQTLDSEESIELTKDGK